jgi:hypothetical protein
MKTAYRLLLPLVLLVLASYGTFMTVRVRQLETCLAKTQPAPRSGSQRLVVKDDKGAVVHTLMSDQYNALTDLLETTSQTNALELFRQYRCAYNADLSSSKLRDTVAALQHLRMDRANEAVPLLEQQLGFYSSIMCNSYGCLNATNRERVNVESVAQARDYYKNFVPSERGGGLEKAMNELLRFASGKHDK